MVFLCFPMVILWFRGPGGPTLLNVFNVPGGVAATHPEPILQQAGPAMAAMADKLTNGTSHL